jgi:hypothetical protein
MFRRLAFLIVAIALAGCGGSTQAVPCQTLVKDYDAAMKDVLARRLTVEQAALVTVRKFETPSLEPFRAIRAEIAAMTVPTCAAKSHELLLESIDERIVSFQTIANKAVSRSHGIRSSDLLLQYEQNIAALLRGETLPAITATP